MRRPTRTAILAPALALALLAGCASEQSETSAQGSSTESVTGATDAAAATSDNAADHDEDSDYDWDAADEVAVTLTGDSATSDSRAVVVDGSTVTITAAGTYRLSGSLTDGQVVVDSADDGVVRLILDGVELSSSTTAPVVVTDAAKAIIVLADGSTNTVSDASTYVYPDAETDEPNAAIFSTADLTITGSGALTVEGNANDAIASKDGLVISGGTITVTAADDGIRGKDYLVVKDRGSAPQVAVTATGDGLKSDNADDATMGYVSVAAGAVTVTAGDDAVQAQTDAIVSGGSVTAISGGGAGATVAEDASAKGIKGDVSVVVSGGSVSVSSADDAVHSNGSVSVSGGELTLAAGDDGVHADAALAVTGGAINITESYEGLEGAQITISAGDVQLVASDDGINVAGGTDSSGMAGPGGAPGGGAPGGMGGEETFTADADYFLEISGGTVLVDADGDGLDANGSIEISGGRVVVAGPTNSGNGAIDSDGGLLMSGGVLVAAGSSGMVVTPATSSPQPSVTLSFSSVQSAGTVVHLVAEDGTTVASFESTKDFQTVVISTPDLVSGQTYTVTVDGTVTGDVVGGVSTDGDSTGSREAGSVTA